MAARSRLVSVTNSATALNDLGSLPDDVEARPGRTIYNDGAITVYLGGSTVTSSGATKGLPLLPGDSLAVEDQGDIVYGITAASTCDVIIFEVGV